MIWRTASIDEYTIDLDDTAINVEKYGQLFEELMSTINDREIIEKLRRKYEEAKVMNKLDKIQEECKKKVKTKRNKSKKEKVVRSRGKEKLGKIE